MQQLHILLGFDEPEFEQGLRKCFHDLGIDVHIAVKFSKLSIREYLRNNFKCQAVVLKEVLNNGMIFTAEELAQLTDERDVHIVAVVSGRHRGTAFMETLYGAGITSVILQDGKKGARPRDICELILHKRSRKDARVYYGLADKSIDLGFLNNEDFVEYYAYYKENADELTCVERFIRLCDRLTSPTKLGDFVRRLPKDDVDELAQYEEFHVVLALLKKNGIKIKVKRPRKVQIGLKSPGALSLEDGKIIYTQSNAEKTDVSKKAGKMGDKNGATKATPVAFEQTSNSEVTDDDTFTMDVLLSMMTGATLADDTAASGEDVCVDASTAEESTVIEESTVVEESALVENETVTRTPVLDAALEHDDDTSAEVEDITFDDLIGTIASNNKDEEPVTVDTDNVTKSKESTEASARRYVKDESERAQFDFDDDDDDELGFDDDEEEEPTLDIDLDDILRMADAPQTAAAAFDVVADKKIKSHGSGVGIVIGLLASICVALIAVIVWLLL